MLLVLINFKYIILNKEIKMFKNCKTVKSLNRQREIEKAFLDLLKHKHYDDITVIQLCDYVKMPRKAFYRYFACKEGLLNALIKHTLDGYQDYCHNFKEPKRTIKGELNCFFSFWLEKNNRDFLDAINKSSLVGHLLKFSREIPANIIDMSKFLPDENSWSRMQVFNFAISGLMSIMLDWYNAGCNQTTAEMSEIASRLLGKPLFQNLDKIGIEIE